MARVNLGPLDPLEPLMRADPDVLSVWDLFDHVVWLENEGACRREVEEAQDIADRAFDALRERAAKRATSECPEGADSGRIEGSVPILPILDLSSNLPRDVEMGVVRILARVLVAQALDELRLAGRPNPVHGE